MFAASGAGSPLLVVETAGRSPAPISLGRTARPARRFPVSKPVRHHSNGSGRQLSGRTCSRPCPPSRATHVSLQSRDTQPLTAIWRKSSKALSHVKAAPYRSFCVWPPQRPPPPWSEKREAGVRGRWTDSPRPPSCRSWSARAWGGHGVLGSPSGRPNGPASSSLPERIGCRPSIRRVLPRCGGELTPLPPSATGRPVPRGMAAASHVDSVVNQIAQRRIFGGQQPQREHGFRDENAHHGLTCPASSSLALCWP